jgi:uncharacterized protein YkwD
VPATTLLSRILPAAAVAASLLVPAAAQAKDVKATVALGDKRPAKATVAKRKAKAKAHVAADCGNTDALPTADNLAQIRAAVLCLHNQTRAAKGLPLLRENAKLDKAALGHSNDMVAAGYFDHTTPGGTSFVDRIFAAGYVKRDGGWVLGENLAWGTGDLSTPDGVMSSWMNSPGHKANILKRAYREVGIGIKLGVPSDGTVGATYTLDFGARL